MSLAQLRADQAADRLLPPGAPAVPAHLKCPISQDLMLDPVSTVDGHTYDRAPIAAWLATRGTSPTTGLPLASKVLVDNLALRALAIEFVEAARRPRKRAPLVEAIEDALRTKGDLSKVRALIDAGADVTDFGEGDIAPIHAAAWSGRIDVLGLLLAKGASANQVCEFGTPLLIAVQYGRVDAVNILLAAGANPNTAASLGDGKTYTPLTFAARYESRRRLVVAVLLDWGAVVNAATGDDGEIPGETPLMAACSYIFCENNLAAVRLLLARGADVRAADKAGRTALHRAAEEPPQPRPSDDADTARARLASSAAVIRALLAAGADPRARDAAGRAPADGAPPELAALFE
jgi:ankyrin repeat protein